jgi:hypothetical protein
MSRLTTAEALRRSGAPSQPMREEVAPAAVLTSACKHPGRAGRRRKQRLPHACQKTCCSVGKVLGAQCPAQGFAKNKIRHRRGGRLGR